MEAIKINRHYTGVSKETFDALVPKAQEALKQLHEQSGKGNDFVGWVDYPNQLTDVFIKEIQDIADEVIEKATTLLVVGIGGSYLGAQSALTALTPTFSNETAIRTGKGLKIYFVGHQMSASYTNALLDHVKDEDIYVNVISKSGTTTEPAVAFRLVKQLMEEKYGDQAVNRIIATTDQARGALKQLADQSGMRTFVIPDDVGGRFSVLTPVGLLPIACAGIDISAMARGLKDAYEALKSDQAENNVAMTYAILRNALYQSGKKVEVLVNYEPMLKDIAEWWKQLFGESEGKDHLGILPHAMNFSTDLHSLGQYVQDGERTLFETVLTLKEDQSPLIIEEDPENLDGLNFLAGKSLHDINHTAMLGTLLAHVDGGVPNILIELPRMDAYHLGYVYYFFMKACGISGYMLGVNPFDQPGVEAYKKNMFGLLGKPGFEAIGEALRAKLK